MERLDLSELDKIFRQQVHFCQALLEENSQEEVTVKAHQTSRAAVSLLQRHSSNEDDPNALLKLALKNYSQSILDTTYYQESKLANAEFADRLSLEKVIDIDKALSTPAQLCGSPEGANAILGTDLIECLYWRFGALLYMYCHSLFEKEERRKDMDTGVFLNCCCAAVGHLYLMLSARIPLAKDEDYISHDIGMVQLLEQGIFSDIHMLALMYAGELCYWIWVISSTAPVTTPPVLTPPHPVDQQQTRAECDSDHRVLPTDSKEKYTSTTAKRTSPRTTDITSTVNSPNTADTISSVVSSNSSSTFCADSANDPAATDPSSTGARLELGSDRPGLTEREDSLPSQTGHDQTGHDQTGHDQTSSKENSGADSPKIDTSDEEVLEDAVARLSWDEPEVDNVGAVQGKRLPVGTPNSSLDLYHVMRHTKGEEFVLRWKSEFNALKFGLEMLSKYINAARGPLKNQGWNYSKAVELMVKLKRVENTKSEQNN